MRVCIFVHHWILSFRCSIELQINFSTNLIFIIFVLFNNFLKFLCDLRQYFMIQTRRKQFNWMAIWEGWKGSSILWEHLKEINVNEFYVQMPFLNWFFTTTCKSSGIFKIQLKLFQCVHWTLSSSPLWSSLSRFILCLNAIFSHELCLFL